MTSSNQAGAGRTLLLGAIGFGVGLGVAGAAFGALTFRIGDYATNLAVGAAMFAVAGIIGGALLGTTRPPRQNIVFFALGGAATLGLGYLATVYLLSNYLGASLTSESMVTAAYVAQFAIVGALAGIMFGLIAARTVARIVELALGGAFGFGLGFFVQDWLSTQLNETVSNIAPGQLGEPNHDSITLAALFGLTFLVAGLIAGAGLGLGLSIGRRALPPEAANPEEA